ncbi:MAG TPA: DUF2400 family protein, partial [Thermoplasmata archaeon]|nr:DUF2400 family protein [Thermoplasmata archaeon]
MRSHRPTPEFPAHLEALYRKFPFDRSLAQDPLSRVRPVAVDRRHAEVAGIFAATLAVGNTASIQRAFSELLRRAGGDLTTVVDRMVRPGADPAFGGFVHRWIRGEHLSFLAYRLHEIGSTEGSLEAVFARGAAGPDGFAGGLDALATALRGPSNARGAPRPPRGYVRLFPTPLGPTHSPCKRMALFVRWMVRSNYPDLGVWTGVDPATLRIPLDHHVYWIAYHLGLTQRRTRNWAAVEEVTAALRAVDSADPIKYDFVLCHTGVSGDCPKERDLAVCGPCVVRPDCRLWRG